MKYLFFLILLSGCGSPQVVTVDPLLLPYFQRFTQKIGVSYARINGQFATLDSGIAGMCIMDGGTKTIQIDATYWANGDDSLKEQLIAHELGHCAMNLAHVFSTTVMEGAMCPTSIMYPIAFGDSWCYTDNEDYYYEEIRNPGLPQLEEMKGIFK